MNTLDVTQLVNEIQDPNGQACRRILKEHVELFRRAPGSRRDHHAWPGGYWQHLFDTMSKGRREFIDFQASDAMATLPLEERFTLSDVMLVLFLHDLEKPWKYCPDATCPVEPGALETKAARREFRWRMMQYYDIRLNGNQINAMEYVEGVRDSDYSPGNRLIWPLGLICHIADFWSARAAYNLGNPA